MSSHKTLPVVTITASAEHEEPIVGRLYLLGLAEMEIVRPDPATVHLTLFRPEVDARQVEQGLATLGEWFPGFECVVRSEEIEDVPWWEVWKQHFRALEVGNRFQVRPPWEAAPLPEGRLPLVIEPRNAFGSGYHETTQLMLEAIEGLDWRGRSYLDAGCGSGILGIAAARLGAARVLAFDRDPEALENTAANVELNGVGGQVEGFTGEIGAVGGVFDVVGANIIATALKEMRDHLVRCTRPGGVLLLSGLLEGDQDGVQAHFEAAGLTTTAHTWRNGWHLLKLVKPAK
jgi:ribosomal protein L11 methyltransferase